MLNLGNTYNVDIGRPNITVNNANGEVVASQVDEPSAWTVLYQADRAGYM